MCTSTNGWTEALMKSVRRGSRFVLFAAIFLLFGAGGNAQESPIAAGQAIRVNVARVNVGVVVTDEKGKFVEGLRREAFHVFDNGGEQPITEFASIEEPGQVLLLVEAGPAAYFLQDANLFAAGAMLNGLSAGDRVAVARYTDAPLGIQDFTADKVAAQAALSSIQFNLGFADLNLSSGLGSVLDWLERVPGKKTIVLISTGVDTSPASATPALQARLRVGDVRILCCFHKRTSAQRQTGQQGQDSANAGRVCGGRPPPADYRGAHWRPRVFSDEWQSVSGDVQRGGGDCASRIQPCIRTARGGRGGSFD